ncbi:MAG: YcxB family protein [Rhodospirillaceae bacterium]
MSDIISVSVRNYFANRARYVVCILVAIAYGLYLVNDLGLPADRRAWMIYIAGGVVFAVAFFVLFLIVGTLNAILMVRHSAGVIGPHEIQVLPEGLRDVTPVTDSLTRWPAIFRITRRGPYLAFWISPYLAHLVPARAFADAEAFAAFERLARAYFKGEQVSSARVASAPSRIQVSTDPALWKRPATS